MENIQNLKMLPWIGEECDIKKYFAEYNAVLDDANAMKSHNYAFDYKDTMRSFFHLPDDLMGQPSSSKLVTRNGATEEDQEKDFFSVDKMENDCSIDLLTCENELPPRELCTAGPISDSGRVTNWYAGAYMDGVIPDNGHNKLATLTVQAQELYKRETVKNYLRLRHRVFKYSQSMRMIMKKENQPEEVLLQENVTSPCLKDILFNIRIHRPFYKRSYAIKGLSRFPRHSQELLMLGSQRLSELRDAISCMNDYYVHKDMSDNPDLSLLPNNNIFNEYKNGYKIHIDQHDDSQKLFPSSFFYFNGTCYPDMRYEDTKDLSVNCRNWSKKYPKIGEINAIKMEDRQLGDLKIRLGYPYLFIHLGNCEHLVVISDIRLVNRTDIQDPSRYPLCRGNPRKCSFKCYACGLLLAKWVVKDDPRLPKCYTHWCDKCLKQFSYNDKGEKVTTFKLYPFIDEFAAQAIRDAKKLESAQKTGENRPARAPEVIEIQFKDHPESDCQFTVQTMMETEENQKS